MFRIEKDFAFSASHRLIGLTADHPCSRLHGHNYVIKIVLQSNKLTPAGFVRDYRNLDLFKKWLDDTFDHRHLNDIHPFNDINPSAENMARYFFGKLVADFPEVTSVGVSETPKTWAFYSDSM